MSRSSPVISEAHVMHLLGSGVHPPWLGPLDLVYSHAHQCTFCLCCHSHFYGNILYGHLTLGCDVSVGPFFRWPIYRLPPHCTLSWFIYKVENWCIFSSLSSHAFIAIPAWYYSSETAAQHFSVIWFFHGEPSFVITLRFQPCSTFCIAAYLPILVVLPSAGSSSTSVILPHLSS